MIQLNISLDLNAVVNDEYGTTLKEVIQDEIKAQVRRAVAQEIETTHRKTINKWVKDGFKDVRFEAGEVVIPMLDLT